jgi:hypothetical protein
LGQGCIGQFLDLSSRNDAKVILFYQRNRAVQKTWRGDFINFLGRMQFSKHKSWDSCFFSLEDIERNSCCSPIIWALLKPNVQAAYVPARKLATAFSPSKQVIGRPRMPGSLFMKKSVQPFTYVRAAVMVSTVKSSMLLTMMSLRLHAQTRKWELDTNNYRFVGLWCNVLSSAIRWLIQQCHMHAIDKNKGQTRRPRTVFFIPASQTFATAPNKPLAGLTDIMPLRSVLWLL